MLQRFSAAGTVPVLEEAPKAKSYQFERGLDHERGREEVVAVL